MDLRRRAERPAPDRPGQDRPAPDRLGQDRPGQDRPGHDRPARGVLQALGALVRGCHPEPTVAVTAVSAGLAASVGRGAAGVAAVTAAVLAGQLSVGWSNDYVDRDRDVLAGRPDKPVATGRVRARTVGSAAVAAALATVPLSVLSGLLAATFHLIAVASAWSYNLRLKATRFSVAPYAVSFGLLPAFVTAGLPGHPVVGWLVLAGALLGSGAHFANVLPDLGDDLRTGIRGLPHRIGAGPSRVAAAVFLLAASAVLAFGPAGPPGPLALGAVAVAAIVGIGGLVLGRRPASRAAFRAVMLVAAVDVLLLLAVGHL